MNNTTDALIEQPTTAIISRIDIALGPLSEIENPDDYLLSPVYFKIVQFVRFYAGEVGGVMLAAVLVLFLKFPLRRHCAMGSEQPEATRFWTLRLVDLHLHLAILDFLVRIHILFGVLYYFCLFLIMQEYKLFVNLLK